MVQTGLTLFRSSTLTLRFSVPSEWASRLWAVQRIQFADTEFDTALRPGAVARRVTSFWVTGLLCEHQDLSLSPWNTHQDGQGRSVISVLFRPEEETWESMESTRSGTERETLTEARWAARPKVSPDLHACTHTFITEGCECVPQCPRVFVGVTARLGKARYLPPLCGASVLAASVLTP